MNQQMAQKIGQDAQQFQINFPISCKSVRTSLWGFLLEPEEYFILKAKVLNKTLKYPISKLLPLLPSRFSSVLLCATPWTAAYQASPSVGFSRQEHWSGLPFPSPSKCLLISWLQSPSAVVLEPYPPKKFCHCFHCFPIYLPWSDGTRCHDLSFLNVEC